MNDMTSSGDILSASIRPVGVDCAVLELVGEIDISSVQIVSSQFEQVAQEPYSAVIIDASGVTFMDSTGLHALVEGKKLIHENGTRIVLVPSRQVRRVLELVFPDPLFATRVETIEEALAAIDSPDTVAGQA